MNIIIRDKEKLAKRFEKRLKRAIGFLEKKRGFTWLVFRGI